MKRRKITLQTLEELAKVMPVISEDETRSYIGGGSGTRTDPYTYEEYRQLTASGSFPGGYVCVGTPDEVIHYAAQNDKGGALCCPEVIITGHIHTGNVSADDFWKRERRYNNTDGSGMFGYDSSDSYHDPEAYGPSGGGGGGGGGSTYPTQPKVPEPNIRFGSNVNSSQLSAKTIDLIKQAMKAIGDPEILITSLARTPLRQAQAMYHNLQKNLQAQKDLYHKPGRAVIAVYEEGLRQHLSKDQIISNMEAAIRRIGPELISKHIADFEKVNVFDVSLSSVSNPQAFIDYFEGIKKAGGPCRKVLWEKENNCIHIEIDQ